MTRANRPHRHEIDTFTRMAHSIDMSHMISDSELQVALSGLPDWKVDDNHLVKTFTLPSFREAVAAIVRIGFEADESNHHPEIRCAYNSLEIRLCTHDAGDIITDKDLSLAAKIEEVVGRRI